MASQKNQQPINQPQSLPTRPFAFKLKSSVFYLSSILILILAISFSFTKTNFLKTQHLKYTFSLHPTLFQTLFRFLHPFEKPIQTQEPDPISIPPNCVLWMAPFLSGGGYSSEAWSYILALYEQNKNCNFRMAIEQHGDLESLEFWEGLPNYMKNLAIELYHTECSMKETLSYVTVSLVHGTPHCLQLSPAHQLLMKISSP